MRSSLYQLINYTLAIAGGALLVVSGYDLYSHVNRPDSKRDHLVANDANTFSELVADRGGISGSVDVDIVFLSPSEYCASVLNDIEDYISTVNEDWGEELSIRMWLAVSSTDPTDYLRFTTTSMLKINYVSIDSPVVLRQLERFGDEKVSQQFIVIDGSSNNIVYRARLRTGLPASQSVKNRILSNARGQLNPSG